MGKCGSAKRNKIYIVGKVLMRAIQKNVILLNLNHCVKNYGHFCQIYQNHSQIMVMSRALASNSGNVYFSLDSLLNFRKSYQIWGKLAQERKVTGKKKTNLGGGKHPPPVLIRLSQKRYSSGKK